MRGVIGLGEVAVMIGAPGSGKSVLAGDLAHSVATGQLWCNYTVACGSVLYLALERELEVERRLAALQTRDDAPNSPLLLGRGPLDLARSEESVARVIEDGSATAVEGGAPLRLIIVDTLARATAGIDENTTRDMQPALDRAALIASRTGAAVLILHHTARGSRDPRGASAIEGAADAVVLVEKLADARRVSLTKANGALEGRLFNFRIGSFSIGTDPDTGEPIAPAIIVAVERSDDPASPSSPPQSGKLSPKAEKVLALLRSLGPEVSRRALLRVARERGIVSGARDQVAPSAEAVRRALVELKSAGLVDFSSVTVTCL